MEQAEQVKDVCFSFLSKFLYRLETHNAVRKTDKVRLAEYGNFQLKFARKFRSRHGSVAEFGVGCDCG